MTEVIYRLYDETLISGEALTVVSSEKLLTAGLVLFGPVLFGRRLTLMLAHSASSLLSERFHRKQSKSLV